MMGDGSTRWPATACRLATDDAGPAQRPQDYDHRKVADFLLALSDMLLNNRGFQESWRLQYKTDLGMLPDYEGAGAGGWPWVSAAGRSRGPRSTRKASRSSTPSPRAGTARTTASDGGGV